MPIAPSQKAPEACHDTYLVALKSLYLRGITLEGRVYKRSEAEKESSFVGLSAIAPASTLSVEAFERARQLPSPKE